MSNLIIYMHLMISINGDWWLGSNNVGYYITNHKKSFTRIASNFNDNCNNTYKLVGMYLKNENYELSNKYDIKNIYFNDTKTNETYHWNCEYCDDNIQCRARSRT